jgi:hypothetical protein
MKVVCAVILTLDTNISVFLVVFGKTLADRSEDFCSTVPDKFRVLSLEVYMPSNAGLPR